MEVFDESGKEVDKEVQEAFETYEKLLKKCEKWEASSSIQQAFEKQGEDVLEDKYFMYNVASDVEFQTSGGLSTLAANGLDDDEFEGQQMLILSGYQRFVDALAAKVPFEVYLNQKVRKVVAKQEQTDVICASGITVSAKNVVFALPIGVLKAKGIQFQPDLPDWKREAIDCIGFGNVCKIVLDFADPNLITSDKHYIGVVAEDVRQRGLATYFLNLKAVAGVPALMTFGLGENADEAQQMPEGQLKQLIAKRLSAFTEEQVSPNDFRMARTSWRTNPNFRGTYAYAATTTREKHWQDMARPVFECGWYFCGEHTTSKYRGTVHGAYLSGVHASKWIKDQVSEQDWLYPDFQEGNDKKAESSSSNSN